MTDKKVRKAAPEDPQSYREAASVIDRILAEIESETDLDVDELADRVERASTLIDFCFERLRRADLRVRKVADHLARTTLAAESEPDSAAEAEADVDPGSSDDS